MKTRLISLPTLVLGCALTAGTAQAFTVATFSDPATSGATPLFSFDAGALTLDGGWSSTGLTLLTPGWGSPDYADATFAMTTVNLTATTDPEIFTTAGGVIDFFDSLSNSVMTITFGSGLFIKNNGFGGSDFSGQIVSITGPGIPGGWYDETFNFSFANPETNGNVSTYTASFTSSAVPEPTTMAALALGLGGILARRRRNQ